MFLFLSKLIPLFIYPLGLALLLLGVAIATFWTRPRVAAIAMILALTVLLLGSNPFIARKVLVSLESQYPVLSEIPGADAIVILGGATHPPIAPRPWVEVNEAGDRVLYGAKLYRDGDIPWVILSGGRVEWRDSALSESADMATLMQAMGVPASAILQDPRSLNTYENVVNVKQILENQQLQGPIILVTSALHMPRALAIFKKQGIEAIAAPTDFYVTDYEPNAGLLGVWFNLLPDAEALRDLTRALKEYVGWAIYRLRGWL